MKLSTETKFDIGQDVYIIFNREVKAAIIENVMFRGSKVNGTYAVAYDLSYDALGNGWYQNHCTLLEDFVYTTKQEADAINHSFHIECMLGAISNFKHEARAISRRYRQCDCNNQAQRDAIKIINRANDELAKLMKQL